MGLPQGSGTILVADDDDDIRSLTGRILRMAGYTALEAVGAASALETLAGHPEVRLVLLDLNMPGSPSCAKTIERLREVRPDLPILVMTGLPECETRDELGGQRITRLLEKPFQPMELVGWIREALGEE